MSPGEQTPQLLAQPRWTEAAQALIHGCVDLGTQQQAAVALMERVCSGLGDALYPAFLRVLAEVNQRGDYAARAAVAQTLAQSLSQGRLPSGRRAGWGAAQGPERAAGRATTAQGSRRRSLGPIEYLCLAAWPAHRTAPGEPADAAELPAEQFQWLAAAVMDLLDCDHQARRLYADHLCAVADDPLDGTLPRDLRPALRLLAQQWRQQPDAGRACSAFVQQLGRSGLR
ncbi:hypothetical protein [Aquabacterium sp. OR-4]|uniref:hypothetical protein n=1 Tax=Aquabacterium sp. OR-4 TaxID=2978127 RepID=UPI0021B283DA|nr:hypothetical protein [Aquabacterium sp. OR-4]MDT7837957.1 hypothetical protein [Aquabacterium sp. OR-4]